MKFRVYIAGVVAIIATLTLVFLGASFIDIKAASKEDLQENKIQTTDEESGTEKISENGSECDVDSASSTLESSEPKYNELQSDYNELVEKYNVLVTLCKELNLNNDNDIKEILDDAAEIITEMGETDLDNASDEDIVDITESIELMDNLLDEIFDGINECFCEATSVEANYEKPDFTITTTSNEEFTLSKQGGNVVVLSFFATWCNPCKEEMKNLQQLYEDNKDSNVKIISICCGEGNTGVSKYMNDNGFTYMAGGDSTGQISESYNVSAIPYTIVFDPKGKVVAEFEGLYSFDEYKEAIKNAN